MARSEDIESMTAEWRRRHDEMERGRTRYIGAHDGRSVPLPSYVQTRELLSGRGGNSDPDAMLGRADRNPLLIAGQMAGTPATVASTAFGVAKAVHDVKSGHPEELIPAAISLLPGLKLNRLMFASREAPSTMEFLLYDRNNPEAVPRVLEVPYKSSAIGALSPARAGSIDKLATVFAKSPRKFVDILKDGPEKTSLLDYYPEISDTEFLIGSDMGDGTLGMALRNPDTGKPAIVLSKDYLRKGGIEAVDGLPMEPLDVVAHEGGAHIPQMIADAYAGTTPEDVFALAYKDAMAAMAGGERIKVSPRSADNMINYGRLEDAIKATYPEDVRNAFFLEPDATDKGILYSLMKDEVEYNAYRNTAGEIHAFDIGARSANPKLRSEPVKELPENALRFRGSDLGTSQDAKGGNTRSDAGGGDAGSETPVSETPVSEAPQNPGGPRIVLNPAVFHDKRDALCVAFNEAFRVVMEMNGFEPVSEPTEKQRKFFADTAYADDELQLRRTILARIATLDTSVSDPTDEQLEETMEMLEMAMEVGAPQNEWEQQAVQRLHDVVAKSLESTRTNGTARQPEPPEDEASTQAAVGGGITDDEEWKDGDVRYVEKDGSYYRQTYRKGETDASSGWSGEVIGKDEWDSAQRNIEKGVSAQRFAEAWDAGTADWNADTAQRLKTVGGITAGHNEINAMVTDGAMNHASAQIFHNFSGAVDEGDSFAYRRDDGSYSALLPRTVRTMPNIKAMEGREDDEIRRTNISDESGFLNRTRTLDLDLTEDELAKKTTDSALAGLANMEPDKPDKPDKPTEPQVRPGDLTDFAKTYESQKLVKPEPGAEGTSSPNWANGAVVGKNDPEAFARNAEPGAEGTSSPNWANGAVVGKNDAAEFGKEQSPAEAAVAGNEALPSLAEAGKGLFTVNAKGQYFAQNRLITKRAAERMLRKRRREA